MKTCRVRAWQRTRLRNLIMCSTCRTRDQGSWRWRQRALPTPMPSGLPRQRPAASHRRPYPDWLVHAHVERRRWDDPDVERFLRDGTPVVLTDVPLTRSIVGRWSFRYLAEHYGGPQGLNVHFTPRSTTRFARFYGRGAGEGGIVGMSFRQFAEAVSRNEALPTPPWRHYMQSTLLWRQDKCRQDESAGTVRIGSESVDHANLSAKVLADLQELDWAWLERMCELGGCEGLSETNLWAGASGGCTPLHFDETNNFLCQVTVCMRRRGACATSPRVGGRVT